MTLEKQKRLADTLARGMILLAFALVSAACSGSAKLTSLDEPAGVSTAAEVPKGGVKPTSKQTTQEVERIFDQYSVPDADGTATDYRLAPMDVVDVSVFEAPNLSRTAQVSSSGYITLPLIADVHASGRTTDQLQSDIVKRLQKDFMQSPQVFVSVKEYNSQRITVDGAVKNPGVYPLKGETSLLQVLATAGGLNEMASQNGIYVMRKVDGNKMAARFDLAEIRKGRKEDPKMRAGDIVIVDESGGKVALRGLREALSYTSLFNLLLL